MKTDLALSHLEVVPGQQGRVAIDVTNNADVIDGVTAIVDGINHDWIRLERPLLRLFPEASDRVEVILDIPESCPAGDYLVIVRIVSTIDPDRQTVHDFWLTVTPVPALEVMLRPSIVTGGAQASMDAIIRNVGNTVAEVTVDALEPTREVDCVADPASLVIPHEAEAVVEIELRGNRPWFGDPVARQIIVTARVDDLAIEQIGTFRQRPKIPRGLLTALILAGIILLWAFIFWWVITRLLGEDDSAKAVGTAFVEGPANIPLARIAATVQGTVTATTTGAGIPRITVEANRVTSDGLLQLVASAATGDDGGYSLGSLVPGRYKLKFSAAGFPAEWYDDAGDAATAAEIELGPRQVKRGIDVEMTGDPGTLVGKIDVPPDSVGDPLTVTATEVVKRDDASATGQTPAGSSPVVTTDGAFVITSLPTPATYLVTVTGEGFATQQFEQTLSGGAVGVANTVQLSAAPGTIEGTVRDAAGNPLGGVAVTVRSGDLEIRSITPTSGNVGAFQVIGLPTPQTYSLTFQLRNYTSETIALSLGPGQGRSGIPVTLVGGNGTVTGRAVNPDGTPLGGATVQVLGENVDSQTTTLTTGSPGSFTITDLPVPGNYTVSVSAPAAQTETLAATFLTGGTQDLGTITVLPQNSLVSGTVSSGGAGLGEVEVTLSDGQRPRVTTSASNPAGRFSFSNIPAGSYTLTFRRTGYQTRVALVTVVAGLPTTQNVSIARTP